MNVILGFGAVLIAMVIVSIILEAAYQLSLDLLVAFTRYLDRRRDRRMGGE